MEGFNDIIHNMCLSNACAEIDVVTAWNLMPKLEGLRNLLTEEFSDLAALSEKRLVTLQLLHLKIDEEADTAIQKLADIISSVNDSRTASHRDLETLLDDQVHAIHAHLKNLEIRLTLVTGCVDTLQSQTQPKLDMEQNLVINKMIREAEALLERSEDEEAREIIDLQEQVTVITKQESVNYAVPVLRRQAARCQTRGGPLHHQSLIDAVSVTNSDRNVTDVEIICLDDNCEQYSTFVSDGSSGSVRVFNTITGELQRTIGAELGTVYGLAMINTPVPMLAVSCQYQHSISIINAVSGELVKTIGTKGAGEGQLYRPRGLYVRPSREANQVALLYVCDHGNHRVQVFDAKSGRSVMTIGTGAAGAGDNQFNRPECITVFEGNTIVKNPLLFVSDYNNERVQVFHANTGAFIMTIGQGVAGAAAGQLSGPVGVTVCVLDNASDPLLIVSECNNSRIQLFNGVTGVSVKWATGSAGGRLYSPRGLRAFLVAKSEIVVYVTDCSNKRVQKINISLSSP